VKPLLHLLLSLPIWLPVYPVRLGSNNCLALLRPVAIGDFRSPTLIGGYWKEFSYEKHDITMCWRRIEDRTEKLEATRQGSGVQLVFCLCRLRTDRCSSLLSGWTHTSHLAGRIKYLLTMKLVIWFGPGPIRVRVLVLKGVWQGHEEWAQGAFWQSSGPWVLRPQFIPRRLPESYHWWSVAHLIGEYGLCEE
jgi:hypothetical protein